MKSILPDKVEHELYGCSYLHPTRTSPEKSFALALLAGGVKSVKLSASYLCDGPNNRDGCLVSRLSIEAIGGERVGRDHMLWAILRRLNISFSGSGNGKDWAQASWHPESHNSSERDAYYRLLDLPMVVCYFNALKDLP
jgi:hypothetical protein